MSCIIVLGVVPLFSVLSRSGCIRSVVHCQLQPGNFVFRVDIHGSCLNGTIYDYIGVRIIVGHAHVGGDITRIPYSVHLDADVVLGGRFHGHLAIICSQSRSVRRALVHRHLRLGITGQNCHAYSHGIRGTTVAGSGKGDFRVCVGRELDTVTVCVCSCCRQVAVDDNVRIVVDTGNRHSCHYLGVALHRIAAAVRLTLCTTGNGLFDVHCGFRFNVDALARNGTVLPDVDRGLILLAGVVDKEILVRSGFLLSQLVNEPIDNSLFVPKDSGLQDTRQGHGGAVFVLAGAFSRNHYLFVFVGNYDVLPDVNSSRKIRRAFAPTDGFNLVLAVLVFHNRGIIDNRLLLCFQDNVAAFARSGKSRP